MVKPRNVMKENGVLTQGAEELAMRWYLHFKNIFNIPSSFVYMPSLTLLVELDESSSIEEL